MLRGIPRRFSCGREFWQGDEVDHLGKTVKKNKLASVHFQGGPPESPADQARCPVSTGVACQPAGVAPLQKFAPDCCRNKQTVPGTPTRVGLGMLGHPNSRFNSPGGDTHHPGRRKDGIWGWTVVGGLEREDSGESISPHVLGAVGQGEVKSTEEKHSARLSGSQPLGVPDVGQVLVVCPYHDGLLGPLQPVAPLREGGVDSQELPISQVVICLRRQDKKVTGWTCWSSSDRWERMALMHTSDASTSTMNCREGWGRMSTGAEVNRLFRVKKASSASGVQEKGRRVNVRAVRGATTRLNPRINRQ